MRKFDKFVRSPRAFLMLAMLCVGMFVSERNAAAQQQPQEIAVDFRNASFTSVVRYLESTYGYDFTYQTDDVAAVLPLTFTDRNTTINEVMSRLLQGTNLISSVRGRSVVISRRVQPTVHTGRVLDQSGHPLVGVVVAIRGGTGGTITDAQGNFRITATPSDDLTFEFRYIGYRTQEIRIRDTTPLTVRLQQDATQIDQVIVTGFGDFDRHAYSGAASSILADDVIQAGFSSIDQMLAGHVSGMSVVLDSGEPGATARIRIRGTSTISANRAPLWVVDGVPLHDPVNIDYADLNSDDAAYLVGSAISGINPNDIESITVLKDAVATAMYGSRAANGVIVVTLRRGASRPPTVGYRGSTSIRMRESYAGRNLMNATERINLSMDMINANLIFQTDPTTLDFGYERLYNQYLNQDLTYSEFDAAVQAMAKRNTDWYRILFRNTVSNQHTATLDGGGDNIRYYGSLGYSNVGGPGRLSSQERYTGVIRLDATINDRLNVRFSLNANKSDNLGYHHSFNPSRWAEQTSRTIPAYNDDGTPFLFFFPNPTDTQSFSSGAPPGFLYSPLNELERTGANSALAGLLASLQVNWRFGNGFSYEFLGSYDSNNTNQQEWATERSYYVSRIRGYDYGAHPPLSSNELNSALGRGGILVNTDSRRETYTMRHKIGYSTVIDMDHMISFDAFSYVESSIFNSFRTTAWGWMKERGGTVSPIMDAWVNDSGSTPRIDGNISHFRPGGRAADALRPSIVKTTTNLASFIGQIHYAFRNKLFVNASARMEGSNSFGSNPKYRFRPIWAAGARYNLSNEHFLIDNPTISRLALRAGWGLQGLADSNTSPDLVARLGAFNTGKGFFESHIAYFPNPDLRWEKTNHFNAGLDLELWNGRLTFTGEVYAKYASDVILNRQISQVNGIEFYKFNGGKMENRGVEAELMGFFIRNRDVDFWGRIIYAYNRNVVTQSAFDSAESPARWVNGDVTVEGAPVGTLYSYHFSRLDPATGYPLFFEQGRDMWDRMVDGQIVETPIYNPSSFFIDVVNSGIAANRGGSPHNGSIAFGARYKNLRLNTQFNYFLGLVARLPGIVNGQPNRLLTPMQNASKDLNNRWKKPGDEAHTNIPALFDADAILRLTMNAARTGFIRPDARTNDIGMRFYDESSVRVASTDHIRMANLTLAYRIPGEWSKRHLGLNDINVSFQASNLFLIADKAWNGFDPMMGPNANVAVPRIFSLNLNVTF